MSTAQRSPATTRMFARVIGPFLVAVCATALVRVHDMQAMVSEFSANPLWGWVAGAFTLLAGLIVVALHPYWRGAAAIGVSLTGWLTTVKGLFLVAFPGSYTTSAGDAVAGAGFWLPVAYLAFVLLGLYLTYIGWSPAPKQSTPRQAGSVRDLPHAA